MPGTPVTNAQLTEIVRLMKLVGRKSYGALQCRVLGHSNEPTALDAAKIIRFLKAELS